MATTSLQRPGFAPATRTAVPSSNPHLLAESTSVLLDMVRLSAALLVVAGHLTFAELGTGMRDRRYLGDLAVPVFFVLSGFVIRFVTRSRAQTLRTYLIDRASRIYSVVLPAMALTLLVSGLCLLLDREAFLLKWGAVSDHLTSRVLLNLTFLSQSWGHNTIPLIDAPFWSLSYECLYYVGYGLLFFLRGGKRLLAVLLWAALAGPQVLFLFPVWCLGCWVYDLYHHLRQSPAASVLRIATAIYLLLGSTLALADHPTLLTLPVHLAGRLSSLPHPLQLLGIPVFRATLLALSTGLLAAIAMLLLLLLSDSVTIDRRNLLARRFRRVADGTFAIYLMHYPLLVLALFLGLLHPRWHALSVLVAVAICLLLVLVSTLLDHVKDAMRRRLKHHLHGRTRRTHSAAALESH